MTMKKIYAYIIITTVGIWNINSLESHAYEEANGPHIHLTAEGEEQQTAAVQKLLQRLIPQRSADFSIIVKFSFNKKKDAFEIKSNDEGEIVITGNRGYSAALGLQYYLKHYCQAHISWSGDQLNLPLVLPKIKSAIKVTLNDKYRYYMNVCTQSYSTVWWDWKRWEREIDWMALNGINLPLAFTGQEFIWTKVFKTFNFTKHELDEFFTGPSFLAWNRMGNIQGWAGPLTHHWLSQKRYLQHRILHRMRSFGMTPVLPAFSGRVPESIKRIYPNASFTVLPKKWGNFDVPYGPVTFLQPTDPLFHRIGKTFLQYYIEEFGTNHIYNTDLFNEMPPPSLNTTYLNDCGKSVFQTMVSQDPEAVWLLQGWMFYSDPDIWTPERSEAFLTSVPIGRMLILDMQAELSPQYPRLNSFYGQPFIWCIVQNYGGVSGLYGSLENINMGPFEARKYPNSTMVGTGMTPEGIETNDIVYELTNEMAWRKFPVHLSKWVTKFAFRRYGNTSSKIKKAMGLLMRSVYNASLPFRNHGKYILIRRPSLKLKPFVWYNPRNVFKAWKLFINASQYGDFNDSSLFRHDLVDLTRQSLSLIMDKIYGDFRKAYWRKDMLEFKNASFYMQRLYDDMEEILATDVHFLFGRRLKDADSCAVTAVEKKQYEYNILNQITLWGPSGQILDYANKQWTGIMSRYYKKRWELMSQILKSCLHFSHKFNQSRFNGQVLDTVEIPFTVEDFSYPVTPEGDAVEISQKLLKKYWPFMQRQT